MSSLIPSVIDNIDSTFNARWFSPQTQLLQLCTSNSIDITADIDIQHTRRWSLVVWHGIVHFIGPYFFYGNVNGVTYFDFLKNELPELLDNVNLETRWRRLWLQQDGAPYHRSLMIRQFLDPTYRRPYIGIDSNISE